MERILKDKNEVAAAIRKELKRHFPGIKFSVRSEYFSGGSSVDVSWNFGPTEDAVRAIIMKYQHGWFDGMTDCYEYEDTVVGDADGNLYELGGVKYVQTQRSFVPGKKRARYESGDIERQNAFMESFERQVCGLEGMQWEPSLWMDRMNCWLSTYVWRILKDLDFKGAESVTLKHWTVEEWRADSNRPLYNVILD